MFLNKTQKTEETSEYKIKGVRPNGLKGNPALTDEFCWAIHGMQVPHTQTRTHVTYLLVDCSYECPLVVW